MPLQMFTVYVLRSSSSGKHYIGCTNNLSRRLSEHNANKTSSIKNRGPYKLLYTEEFVDRSAATKREKQIKSYKGGNALKVLLKTLR